MTRTWYLGADIKQLLHSRGGPGAVRPVAVAVISVLVRMIERTLGMPAGLRAADQGKPWDRQGPAPCQRDGPPGLPQGAVEAFANLGRGDDAVVGAFHE